MGRKREMERERRKGENRKNVVLWPDWDV